MNGFKDRDRYGTYEEALEAYKKGTGWILHILVNEERDFSIMGHLVCEWCDYCDQRNLAFKAGLRYSNDYPLVHMAKEDPYEDNK